VPGARLEAGEAVKHERLELLLLARDATSPNLRDIDLVAAELHRFAPTSISEATWRDTLASVREGIAQLDAPAELLRRLRVKKIVPWQRIVDHVLPALALGVAATDSAVLAKLVGRDAWTAAVAARIMGLWETGTPPSLSAVCDAFAWRTLGLPGRAKRCPPEVRALFLQRELASSPAAADRQLRLFVARELETGTELRAIRDGLVRRWIQDKPLHAAHDLAADVKRLAASTTRGGFGDRKVFISSLWDELRRDRHWASLSLADFKTGLVAAQRAGTLELARADLVAAMDPELLAASEIRDGGASFHFMLRGTDP